MGRIDAIMASSDVDDHVNKKKRNDDVSPSSLGPTCVDWSIIPGECLIFGTDNKLGGKKKGKVKKNEKCSVSWKVLKKEARVERKERQCDAFVAAISALCLPPGAVVVDGGCGSCGLTLPLAWTFPHLVFVGIDMNPVATELMMERVAAAGLTNVRAFTSSISAFTEPFDLAIGLHACGQASDDIIHLAVMSQKPYLVAPCCFGKLKFSFRSNALLSTLSPAAVAPDEGESEDCEAPMAADEPPKPLKRGPAPPRHVDDNHCGYVARRLRENEGRWDALEYPRSGWLQAQLLASAAEINRAAALTLESRAQESKSDEVGEGGLSAEQQQRCLVSSFAERGDMRVLNLEERMNSMYLAVAGYADNSHMRSVPDLVASVEPQPLAPAPPARTEKEQKKDLEHDFYRLCSNVICVDRNEFAAERAGYCTRICTMPGLSSSAKSDLLIGWLPRC